MANQSIAVLAGSTWPYGQPKSIKVRLQHAEHAEDRFCSFRGLKCGVVKSFCRSNTGLCCIAESTITRQGECASYICEAHDAAQFPTGRGRLRVDLR